MVFSGNSANFGGAECIIFLLPQALSIRCLAEIQLLRGGGIFNTILPQVLSIRCLAEISYYGGGMYNTSSSPSIVNSTFSGNSATTMVVESVMLLLPLQRFTIAFSMATGSDIENSF